jgi:hypothetical protein
LPADDVAMAKVFWPGEAALGRQVIP